MSKRYSIGELKALEGILEDFGNIQYINNFDIEREFFLRCGKVRKSGPLYMAAWRLKKGYYSNML